MKKKIGVLKYGYGRATDQLNVAIKSKLISRKEALKIVKKLDGKVDEGNEKKFCKYLKISKTKYDEIINSFVNHDLFLKGNKGNWIPKFKRS